MSKKKEKLTYTLVEKVFLTTANFKRIDMDDKNDKEAHCWLKKVKHKYMKGVEVSVCTDISVWVLQPKRCDGGDEKVAILNMPFTIDNLNEVLDWLRN